MKKTIFILVLLFITASVFALQDSTSAISEFSARLKKSIIYLHWNIHNTAGINKIRLEMKYSGENVYRYLNEINTENYSKKTLKESEEYLEYNYLYKPDKNGVYYFRITLTDKSFHNLSSDEIKIGVTDITEFKLHQNSPNPFNPSTSIGYELFTAAKVLLKIYSLDGKEIETLVDDYQQPGTYKIDFNAGRNTELSSGIYFYKLQTNHSSDIKKMIFTK